MAGGAELGPGSSGNSPGDFSPQATSLIMTIMIVGSVFSIFASGDLTFIGMVYISPLRTALGMAVKKRTWDTRPGGLECHLG